MRLKIFSLRFSLYVIRMSIFKKRSQGLLGLSQKGYMEEILRRFDMNNCSAGIASL